MTVVVSTVLTLIVFVLGFKWCMGAKYETCVKMCKKGMQMVKPNQNANISDISETETLMEEQQTIDDMWEEDQKNDALKKKRHRNRKNAITKY